MALSLVLNGHLRDFPSLEDSSTLAQLIEALGLKPDRVAVERNGTIVARGAWDKLELQSGDKLEVVHFVGGGAACPSL